MVVLKPFLLVALTALLLPAFYHSLEDSLDTPEVGDTVDSLKSQHAPSAAGQFQDVVDTIINDNPDVCVDYDVGDLASLLVVDSYPVHQCCLEAGDGVSVDYTIVEMAPVNSSSVEEVPQLEVEHGDSKRPETPSGSHEDRSHQDRDTVAVTTDSEGSETENDVESLNDGTEDGTSSDTEDSTKNRQPPMKVVLQAFGPLGAGDGESTESQSAVKEDEIWTEQKDDGTEQKRSGGRRFFSLMNLIKFLLNPVIEEFEEVEKSSSSHDNAASASNTDSNNKSELADVSAGNSSEVGDKDEKKNGTESGKKTKFQCVGRNVTDNTTAMVRIVNSTVLLEVLSFDKNHSSSDCVLVMFYAPWCHFCAATAPHYNAIARAFPQLEVLAVDTVHFSNLNARFGTVAVPNIMLFHQSRSAVRFNHTERQFHTLLQFIANTTGLEANSSVEPSPVDYEGPLSSTPTEETDYLLLFAWFFIVVCSGHIFISSQIGQHAIERVVVLWQEHQHIE